MADAKPSRPEADQAEVPEPKGPGAKSKPAPSPTNGYYRTKENVVVFRDYSVGEEGDYSQYVAQGPNGELPEGVTNSMVKNDE